MNKKMGYEEFIKWFPTESYAIDFIIASVHHNGCICPMCEQSTQKIYHQKYNHRFFYCNNCKSEFSALSDTIFENTHLDLRMWLYAIYIYSCPESASMSITKLQKALGLGSYRPVWRMYHVICKAINQSLYINLIANLKCLMSSNKKNMSSVEKTKIKGISKKQGTLFGDVTFSSSKYVAFQRWYPYIEGYSIDFVDYLIRRYCGDSQLIYDPFAGTGTTLFASDINGKNTLYSEVNPLLQFLIQTKLKILSMPLKERISLADDIESYFSNIFEKVTLCQEAKDLKDNYTEVFNQSEYFPKQQYKLLLKFRTYIDEEYSKGNVLVADLLTVALLANLIPVSYLKKQGDVRFKNERELKTDMKVLEQVLLPKLSEIVDDIRNTAYSVTNSHILAVSDAKKIGTTSVQKEIDAVITSPPYLNGTNYFRNTKLELWFLRFLTCKADLRLFRDEALTSGINDVKKDLQNDKLELKSVCLEQTLSKLNLVAYDCRIPIMVKCYFAEMWTLFSGLGNKLKKGARVLIDLGDSIFSGIHIKTDYILVEILKGLNYELNERIVLRERKSRNGETLSQVLLVFTYNK